MNFSFFEILEKGSGVAQKSPDPFFWGYYLYFIIVAIVLVFILGAIFLIRARKYFPDKKKILEQKIKLLEEANGKKDGIAQGQLDLKAKEEEVRHLKRQFLGEKGELIVTLKRNEERIQELQHKKDELAIAKSKLEVILKEKEAELQKLQKKTDKIILNESDQDLSREVERYKDVLSHISSLGEKVAAPDIEIEKKPFQKKGGFNQKSSKEASHLSEKETREIINSSAALGKFPNEI
ncbi:MAG: hypothetical protein HQ596_04515 [Candidatus Saganbacteria bacterium]|nr:hypothetical protein [Candidatus Saganbacteria bacterium]